MPNSDHHILHITPIFWDNWAYQENILTEYQAKKGFKVTVVAPSTSLASYRNDLDGTEKVYFTKGVRVIRLKLKLNLINRFFVFKDLLNILISESPEIIMVHGLQMLPILDVIKYKRKFPKCKVYADIHCDHNISASNFISKYILHRVIWNRLICYSVPYIEKIYYTRPSVLAFIQDMYKIPMDHLEELLMGIDTEDLESINRCNVRSRIRKSLNIPDNVLVLCTGGKINRDKKINLIAEAIQSLDSGEIHVVVFGKIEDDYCDEFNSIVQNNPNIHFIGWVEGREVYNYFIACDVSIFLGRHSVLWEQAVASGVGMILKYNSHSTYLNVGGNVMFLYSDNSTEISQYLFLLKTFPEIVLNMKNISKSKGEIKFSYENILNDLHKTWGIS